MVNRRSFLGGTAAFAAVGAWRAQATESLGEVRMRFGALADIHIKTSTQQVFFEKALRKFDVWKADGVLVSGDIADYGLAMQLQMAADVWFKVFPGGKRSDGEPVANLLHYGDHDMAVNYVDRPEAVAQWPDAEMRRKNLIFRGDRKAIWERCFKEEWHPIELKRVKGYPFVLFHFTRGEPENRSGQGAPGLAEFLKAHRFDADKPVFYSQHRLFRDTVCGPDAHGCDGGEAGAALSALPNAIAFCGHGHVCGFFEKNIWQGAFTAIEIPSLRYCCTPGGRENGYCVKDRPPRPPVQMMPQHPSHLTHQGFFCTVHEHGMTVRRWEFEHDMPLGPDWVIPFASFRLPAEERPFAFGVRAKTEKAPMFPADASISISRAEGKDRCGRTHRMYAVKFPPAPATAETPRANDYEVSLELRQNDVERIILQKRVFSPRYLYGAAMDTLPVECLFAEEEVPERHLLRFVVRPVNAFGGKGAPIATAWRMLSLKSISKEQQQADKKEKDNA